MKRSGDNGGCRDKEHYHVCMHACILIGWLTYEIIFENINRVKRGHESTPIRAHIEYIIYHPFDS